MRGLNFSVRASVELKVPRSGLLEQPIITAPEVVAKTGRSSGAVYGQIKKFVDIGVLRGPIGSYNRLYVAEAIWTAISR